MANYVLVHGAWHGGWCYRDTAAALRRAGHNVFTPTHTGVGERAHQANESITLETHVRDVLGCIEAEELDEVILCGHSYGGMVITQLADRIPDKISALVYIDAFVPEHGESLIDLLSKALEPEIAAQFIVGFRGDGSQPSDGMMQPIPAEMFGILEQNRPWVERRCVPQSLATFEMPVLIGGNANKIANRTYLLADNWDPSPFRYFADKFSADSSWKIVKMPSSHDIMVDMPEELATELLKLS
ncbi:MAG: alpha/beta fold hydrolase [Granulosicoccus sp.]